MHTFTIFLGYSFECGIISSRTKQTLHMSDPPPPPSPSYFLIFSRCSFSRRKGWQDKVIFEKCISFSAPSICSFSLQTATPTPTPSICTGCQHTHTQISQHMHLLPDHWQWYPWLRCVSDPDCDLWTPKWHWCLAAVWPEEPLKVKSNRESIIFTFRGAGGCNTVVSWWQLVNTYVWMIDE